MSNHHTIKQLLAGTPALGGAADARELTNAITAMGSANGDDQARFAFENALSDVLDGAETIGETDDDSAYGYMNVLGAAMRMPMINRINPMLIGRSGATMSRMNAVIQAATRRQEQETLRPNVVMIFQFDHTGATTKSVKAKPSLPGVTSAYNDVPLTLRQMIVLLMSGSYASAVINPKVAQIPMFQFLAPDGDTPPNGMNIQRFAPSSYNYGLNSFSLRATSEITLLTELSIDSISTASVSYQVLMEMRAESAFGASTRCILPRGPSAIRGAAAFAR